MDVLFIWSFTTLNQSHLGNFFGQNLCIIVNNYIYKAG